MTCIICGSPLPANRQKFCRDACEAEGNRRVARERYRRQARDMKAERAAGLPKGQLFRCVYDGEDNDTIPPFIPMTREAVRDFVGYGAPVAWFEVVR